MNLPDNIKRIYIDGQRRSFDVIQNYNQREAAVVHYKHLGYDVVNPHVADLALAYEKERTHQPIPKHKEFAGYQTQLLSECDALVLLDGWQLDKDCHFKIAFCVMYGMPVFQAYSNQHILAEVDVTPHNVEIVECTDNNIPASFLITEPIENYN